MKRHYIRFKDKFHFVAGGLLVIVIVLSALFYVSAERFHYHLERNKLARNVLVSYLSASTYAYRTLGGIEDLFNGNPGDQAWTQSGEQLRFALSEIRQGIATELTYVRDEDEREELELLAEVERLSERLIRGGTLIQGAILLGDQVWARKELAILHSDAVRGRLNSLINEASEEERQELGETETEADLLVGTIRILLPVVILLIVMPGLLLIVLISRSLRTSLAALDKAAKAYGTGHLEYRTELAAAGEFARLGDAFNQMAEELQARREADRKSQQSLEAQVQARTEELEEVNSKLEAFDRSRRLLLADISHELRTPLTVIQGESEMALRGNVPKSPKEYREALSRVHEQVLHTARLVDDLLFMARSEEGHARIEKCALELTGLLRVVCQEFDSVASIKSLEIIDTYTDEEAVVLGDVGRLRQVFMILLDNAIRYSHSGGKIFVAQVISADNGTVELIFRDQGIGLTEEEAQQAFYRFYRGDSAEHHAHQGAGLGLPVAKAIVEAHDGSIRLSGTPDKGAEAVVRLPLWI